MHSAMTATLITETQNVLFSSGDVIERGVRFDGT